jgi:hypothetical protein
MININISELEDFKLKYDTEISTSMDYLKVINQELNNLKEYISTPNIGAKIEEFHKEYSELLDIINNTTELMSNNIGSTIEIYQALNNTLGRGVNNEKL